MRNYKIHLIRHGKTVGNAEGRFVGSTDDVLSTVGMDELDLFCKDYGYPGVGALYCSPKKRCLETAGIIYPDMTPEVVEDLREIDFGKFENKTYAELAGDKDFDDWVENGFMKTAPGAEPVQEFHERCCAAFESVLADMMKRKVFEAAIVTHSIAIMHIMARYALHSGENIVDWLVGNGIGFTVLVNTQIWMNDSKFEVAGGLPLGFSDTKSDEQYALYNIDAEEIQDKMKDVSFD